MGMGPCRGQAGTERVGLGVEGWRGEGEGEVRHAVSLGEWFLWLLCKQHINLNVETIYTYPTPRWIGFMSFVENLHSGTWDTGDSSPHTAGPMTMSSFGIYIRPATQLARIRCSP